MAMCKSCGKGGLFQKLDEGLCLSCQLERAKKEISRCHDLLKPEMLDEERLRNLIDEHQSVLKKQEEDIAWNKKFIEEQIVRKQELSNQILIVSDEIEMETYSLYRPQFDFANSSQYKDRLAQIREDQKQLIKNKRAGNCSETWRVNGSLAEGRKMSNDNIKMLLRSFNNECDIAIGNVRVTNYERSLERINRSFETLNKLGSITYVSISRDYLDLKKQELALALEFQQKKEQEREELRALKAKEREEARVQKEIEEARKQAEKEKKHYIQALEALRKQEQGVTDEAMLADIREKQNEIAAHLDEVEANLADIDYRQNNQRAGYVYIISNIGSFGENVYKIGMTRRLEPMERIYELGDASVPFMFDVHAMIFTDDAPKLEAALHNAFQDRRVNMVNMRREYFRVTLDEIKDVIRKNFDKTVEFVDVPEAQQYRDSLQIKKLKCF